MIGAQFAQIFVPWTVKKPKEAAKGLSTGEDQDRQ
jgi:hypothetical protein